MAEISCQISGTGSAPINLSNLVVTAFINYEFLVFHLKATGIYDLFYSNPKDLFADEIIQTLNTKFRSLKVQGLWNTSKGN